MTGRGEKAAGTKTDPGGGQEAGVTSALCALREQELYSHSHSHSHLLQDPEGSVQLVLTLGEEVTGVHRPRLGLQAVQVRTEGILSDKWMGGACPRVRDSP